MTQNQELLQLLIERKVQGVNSFEPFRNNHRQLPRMVNDLRKLGHNIVSLPNKDTSVTYVLTDSPITKQPEVSHNTEYIFVGNRAIPTEAPRQEALL